MIRYLCPNLRVFAYPSRDPSASSIPIHCLAKRRRLRQFDPRQNLDFRIRFLPPHARNIGCLGTFKVNVCVGKNYPVSPLPANFFNVIASKYLFEGSSRVFSYRRSQKDTPQRFDGTAATVRRRTVSRSPRVSEFGVRPSGRSENPIPIFPDGLKSGLQTRSLQTRSLPVSRTPKDRIDWNFCVPSRPISRPNTLKFDATAAWSVAHRAWASLSA